MSLKRARLVPELPATLEADCMYVVNAEAPGAVVIFISDSTGASTVNKGQRTNVFVNKKLLAA